MTHWVEQHGEKQLSPTDAFVQFLGSTRVFLVVDGVSEQATRLTGQDLDTHADTRCKKEPLLILYVDEINCLDEEQSIVS